MRALLNAIAFLTRIPVPARWLGASPDLRASTNWFPVVGLLIGMIIAAAGVGMMRAGFSFAGPVLVVSLLALLSGGLHLDGLADTADGLLSGRPRERMLEIMKEPTIGGMGASALILVLMGKAALVAELAARAGEREYAAALILLPIAGRTAQLLGMALAPYARESGVGGLFWRGGRGAWLWPTLALGASLTLTQHLLHRPLENAVILTALWLLANAAFARACIRKIGGQTGDTLGAASELNELLLAALLVAFPSR